MAKNSSEQKIYVSFRFHLNLYHSDRKEEIGENNRDERIINHVIDSLNSINDKGIGFKGTWDIDNYYTMEQIAFPQWNALVEKLQQRKERGDEIEGTGYSGSILTALNNEECEYVLKKMIKNEAKSGLVDLFSTFEPIIRPRGGMMSPSLISPMRSVGLTAVSLYYSATPNTSFTNYIKPLKTKDRYNPIYYKNPNTEEKITLIPCINIGDIKASGGMVRYINKLATKQKAEDCGDLLLLVDFSCDDEYLYGKNLFWKGKGGKERKGGIYKVIEKLSKKSNICFTTPYEYLKTHTPDFELSIPMDLAAGSFEGYSSWAEKWENTEIFKYVERARYYSYLASNIAKENKVELPIEIFQSLEKRVLVLSSSHFGCSSPLVNIDKVNNALKLAKESEQLSLLAYEKVKSLNKEVRIDNPYFYMNEKIEGVFPLNEEGLKGKYISNGKLLASFISPIDNKHHLIIKDGSEKLPLEKISADNPLCLQSSFKSIENDNIKITLLPSGAFKMAYKGENFIKRCMRPVIKYKGKLFRGEMTKSISYNVGDAQILKVFGEIKLPKAEKTTYQYSMTLAGDIPVAYFDGKIQYPETKVHCSKKFAKALGRDFDDRYKEVMPFEILPEFTATDESPFLVSKHNYFGEQYHFPINFGKTTNNRRLDSFNNAVTCGYISVGNGEKGILISQSLNKDVNFAFCPMRIVNKIVEYSVRLNPFGTYYGIQHKNILAGSFNKSNRMVKKGIKYNSQAPSYNGKVVEVSLMIAPFYGQTPNNELIKTAYLHAYPPMLP